jgi:tetratricopeptide (TPR) repeat protein
MERRQPSNAIDRLISSASSPQETLVAAVSNVLAEKMEGDDESYRQVLELFSNGSEGRPPRVKLFKLCRDLCEARGRRDIGSIFRCMALWPVVESVEALIESPFKTPREVGQENRHILAAMAEKANSAKPDIEADMLSAVASLIEPQSAFERFRSKLLTPEERELLLGDDLRRAADDLEELYNLLDELDARETLKRAHQSCRQSLALYARTLVKGGKWADAAKARARYMKSYYMSPPEINPDRPRLSRLGPLEIKPLGANLGLIHFKAKMVHGTLLLENISPGGGVSSLGKAGSVDPHDIKLLAEDLTSLRYQLSHADWQDFREAYVEGAASEEARRVLERAEELAPDNLLGREEETLPFHPLITPHWIIRAIRFAIRHSGQAHVDLRATLNSALGCHTPDRRIDRLQMAALAAEGIDEKLYQECLEHLVNDLQVLIMRGEVGTVSRQAEISLTLFSHRLTGRRRTHLQAQQAHLDALNTDDLEKKTLHYRAAGKYYLGLGDPVLFNIGMQCLESARSAARTKELYAAVICDEMRALLNAGIIAREGRYIAAAIGLGRLVEDFPEPHLSTALALLNYCRALVEPDEAARKNLLQQARINAERVPGMDDLASRLREMLSNEEDAADTSPKLLDVDLAINFATQTGDWRHAAELLTRELRSPNGKNNQPITLIRAGQLALAYTEIADHDPGRVVEACKVVAELAADYASLIFQTDGLDIKRLAASNLGWALARLPMSPALRQTGVDLLELAVSLESPEQQPASYSCDCSNLANAYRALAQFKGKEESKELLLKAERFLGEVISIDERLSQSADMNERRAGESLDLDYLNLGLVRRSLSVTTYDKSIISEKPLDSAKFLRGAIRAFSRAVEESSVRPAIASTAQLGLAECFTDLCRHYYEERFWAANDLDRAFYDWMCEVAGSHISTQRWIVSCAETALQMAEQVALYGVEGNASVLIESVEAVVDLWGLMRRSDEMPDHVRLHCAISIAELGDRLSDSGRAAAFAREFEGFEELARLACATCEIDLFRQLEQESFLLESLRTLEECSQGNHPVVNGIARSSLKWLRVESSENGHSVNGLYMGGSRDGGLEFHLSDQRRTFTLKGMSLFSSNVRLAHKRMMQSEISRSVAHLEPMLELDRVPEFIAVGAGVAISKETEYDIETVRIPTPCWDTWLITLSARRPGKLMLEINAPFLGRYNPTRHEFGDEFPVAIEQTYEVLSFGERGLSVEILMPHGEDGGNINSRGRISLGGSRERPLVSVEARGCRILLKSAPQVISCEAAILAKDEGAESALCCNISPPLSSPSRSFPVISTNSFAPLFFFGAEIESGIITFLQQAETRSLVIVGLPGGGGEICRLLESVYDPALEIFLVVNESEIERAVEELNDFSGLLSRRQGSLSLFASETVYVGETNPLSNVQVIVVPKGWAPAAVQMLLDLSQLRRINFDGLPMLHEGKIMFLQSKGNMKFMRKLQTMLPGVSSFESLISLYTNSQHGFVGEMHRSDYLSVYEHGQLENLTNGKIPKRPLYILPEDADSCVTLSPHVRQKQAIAIPLDELTSGMIEKFKPEVVYAPFNTRGSKILASLNCAVLSVPSEMTKVYQEIVHTSEEQFARAVNDISISHPHLKSQIPLITQLQPSRYAMLCTWSRQHAAWAITLANYAAALGGPILFTEEPDKESLSRVEGLLTNICKLKNPSLLEMPGAYEPCERQASATIKVISSYLGSMIQPQLDALEGIAPNFVGVATFNMLPIELAGSPPLMLRYATGRLSGPDLASTCEIIARAALAEEISRKSWLEGLLIGASGSKKSVTLRGVLKEVESTRVALAPLSFVRLKSLIDDTSDLSLVKSMLHKVDFFHFAGHASDEESDTGSVEILLTGGALSIKELPPLLERNPLIVINACSSAAAGSTYGRTASSLASEFLSRGAVNYIGNLWPALDDASAAIAREFYKMLCSGVPIGEALLHARTLVFTEDQSTWAGMILFGCPRNSMIRV